MSNKNFVIFLLLCYFSFIFAAGSQKLPSNHSESGTIESFISEIRQKRLMNGLDVDTGKNNLLPENALSQLKTILNELQKKNWQIDTKSSQMAWNNKSGTCRDKKMYIY